MKKVVVVSSSLRVNSTSRVLTNEMVKGLKENNEVTVIDLLNVNLSFCKGCLACQQNGKCVIKDDVSKYLEVISSADILVFASPIYYYSISGQLKTFLDRLNPLFIADNNFKEVYALFTCADDSISAIEGPTKAIEGWVSCFEGVTYKTSFNGLAINAIEDVTEDIKQKAYEFGTQIK